MKITTLIENSIDEKNLLNNEHGLSMFIETQSCNILFDTGKTGDFIENAEKLNVDLEKITHLILSHAHYDHCGGVKKLLEKYNIQPKLFIGSTFFDNMNKFHYSDGNQNLDFSSDTEGYKYVGIDFDENYIKQNNLHINYIDSPITYITKDIFISSKFTKTNDFEHRNPNMLIKDKDNYIIDNFSDEICLGINTNKGLLILVGCSHPGIINMLDSIHNETGEKIYGIVGGTHLVEADEIRIQATIDHLKNLGIELIGVSHCTGEQATEMLKNQCDNFFKNCTGKVIEL